MNDKYSDDEVVHDMRIKVALLEHRVSQIESTLSTLQEDRAVFLSTTNKVTGAIVVLSTIGSAIAGYVYDKYLK